MAKEFECLMPPQFTESVARRIFWLEKVLGIKQKSLENAPPGSVRIVRKKRTNQFYLRENDSDLQGKYIPRSQGKIARALCQKVYDKRIVSALQKEITYLKDFLNNNGCRFRTIIKQLILKHHFCLAKTENKFVQNQKL